MAKPKPTVHFTPEARDAAARELMTLANRMFRGGQNLMNQAVRLIEGDPAKDRRTMASIVRYQNEAMPAFDEVARIEAILRGIPPEECLSGSEMRRREREDLQHKKYEFFQQSGSEWVEFCNWKIECKRDKRQATPKAKLRAVITEDGVIQGPWGEA